MGKSKRGKKRIKNYYKFFTSLSIIVILFIILFYLIFQIYSNYTNKKETTDTLSESIVSNNDQQINEKKDTTIHIAAFGDAMCHSQNFKDAFIPSKNIYDFSHVFENVTPHLENADITIGNLETTFAGEKRKYSGYPTFNTPSTFGNALKNSGVDILCTANNHSIDKGYSGIVSTLEALDETGLEHIGTARSKEEQNNILIKDINGIKIAFLAYTYGTNGIPIPSDKEYCVNLINKDLIKSQINLAKEQNVDLICVNMHWGLEYQTKQNSEQEKLADFLFENGVDIILGSHPHVLQPMEKRTIKLADGSTKDGFVIYSLGNFISGQRKEYTQDTVILNISVTKHKDDTITIDKILYTPVYVNDKGRGASKRFQLLDIESNIKDYEDGKNNIGSTTYKTIKTRLEKIEKIVGPEIGNEE